MSSPLQQMCLAAALAAIAGCVAPPPLDGDSPEEDIVRFYEGKMRIPSCSVACVRGDAVSFGGDPRAIYRMASLTKLFLRPAFESLHSGGRIDLDSPVVRCAPFPIPAEYGKVSLRDLLDNASGLPRDFLNPWNPLDAGRALLCGFCGVSLYGGFENVADFADGLRCGRSLRHVRDRRPQYSNVGFALLALSVENVTGRSIDAILADEVTGPLGLSDTAFAPSAAMAPRVTPPCAGDLPWIFPRGSQVEEHPLGPALRGTGALLSSAADCAAFFAREWAYVDSLIAERPLDLCADGEDRGLLRAQALPSGRRCLFRAGMIYGGASFVCFVPSTRTILIVLRNATSWPTDCDFAFADRCAAQSGKSGKK